MSDMQVIIHLVDNRRTVLEGDDARKFLEQYYDDSKSSKPETITLKKEEKGMLIRHTFHCSNFVDVYSRDYL